MKRKPDSDSFATTVPAATPQKKTRSEKRNYQFTDVDSVRRQAQPYLLATAKFPIDALTYTWSIGSNRRVDRSHVKFLCGMFMRNRLERRAEENRLLVLCTQEEVDRIKNHCSKGELREADNGGSDSPSKWPIFTDWLSVNGQKAELMAGQHRVEALKEYVELTRSRRDELWWVCDIYNKGTPLPPDPLNPARILTTLFLLFRRHTAPRYKHQAAC